MTLKAAGVQVIVSSILGCSAHNAVKSHRSNRINDECALREDEVTQAIDGFAIAGPMICKLSI